MRLTLESTTELAAVNGIPVRVWTGKTDAGAAAVAFITRIAFPNLNDAELAEVERELMEAPTRVVVTDEPPAEPAPPVPARSCTVCRLIADKRTPARYLARDALGLEWFECGEHGPDAHPDSYRVAIESLAAWYARNGLPVPPDPDAPPLPAGHVMVPTDKVAELASECRSLRERLKDAEARATRAELDREPHWLIKDFHVLYRAARDVLTIETLAASRQTREALRAQVERLKPAFLACEGARMSTSEVPS
jgi:hypothetical protein